jgi:hypothetical protein
MVKFVKNLICEPNFDLKEQKFLNDGPYEIKDKFFFLKCSVWYLNAFAKFKGLLECQIFAKLSGLNVLWLN